jgi:hypothetical protein
MRARTRPEDVPLALRAPVIDLHADKFRELVLETRAFRSLYDKTVDFEQLKPGSGDPDQSLAGLHFKGLGLCFSEARTVFAASCFNKRPLVRAFLEWTMDLPAIKKSRRTINQVSSHVSKAWAYMTYCPYRSSSLDGRLCDMSPLIFVPAHPWEAWEDDVVGALILTPAFTGFFSQTDYNLAKRLYRAIREEPNEDVPQPKPDLPWIPCVFRDEKPANDYVAKAKLGWWWKGLESVNIEGYER